MHCIYQALLISSLLTSSSALDPAGPLFKKNDVRFRLDRGDAAYVDVIHTSLLGIGTSQANGHTEFFPNGGKKQNGCSSLGKRILR